MRTGVARIQRFEAQHHEHVERAALAAGGPEGAAFTDAESTATYFGNWSRDLSQAFSGNPVVGLLGRELLFEILNMAAMQKFGRGLSPKDFGVYSPREHIDNPAGQINADLLAGPQRPTFAQFGPQEQAPAPGEDISSPEAIGSLFTVNAAGLPSYLGRSIQYVEEEFTNAANLGRTQDGLMHFGNGLHTVEDLFAHSNFIEIALGQLLRDGGLPVSPQLAEELRGRTSPTAEGGQGLDPVETFTGRTAGPNSRPILTTGSFVTDDTMISISEAATAFFQEFEPFSPSNPQRSQQTMELLLDRYQKLSSEDQAGTVVSSFMSSLGSNLTDEMVRAAEEGVAGEQPAPDAPWWRRALGWARRGAGALTGLAMRGIRGAFQSSWVRSLTSWAANAFGKLPLKKVYRFTAKLTNEIDDFLEKLDKKLEGVPGYTKIRDWLRGKVDGLRQTLKPVIQGAVRFVGQVIQKVFAAARVAGTNIQQQIRSQIDANVKNAEARRQLQAATPEQQISMLLDPNWCAQARIDPVDLERLRQMVQVPAYVRAGPSHSQIAKDHADSPFFGTATALANHVVTDLRNSMVRVWQSEGRNVQTDPRLQQNYAGEIPAEIQSRRAPPGTPESQMTVDQRRAEREAAEEAPHYKELRRRWEGEQLRETGAIPEGEESHGAEEAYGGLVGLVRALSALAGGLPGTLRALADRVATAAPDTAQALRRIAADIPKGLEHLAEEIEEAADPDLIEHLVGELRELAREKEGLVAEAQQVLEGAAAQVERLDMRDAADRIRRAATQVEPLLRRIGGGLKSVADQLEERGRAQLRTHEQVEAIHALPPVATGEWAPELAASHGGAAPGQAQLSPERQALFALVRQIFSHPYDNGWWRDPLLAWASRNQERLESYIRARNSERMHHHTHQH